MMPSHFCASLPIFVPSNLRFHSFSLPASTLQKKYIHTLTADKQQPMHTNTQTKHQMHRFLTLSDTVGTWAHRLIHSLVTDV